MLNFYRLRAVAGMELIDNNQYQRISVKSAITQLNKFVAELGEHGHDEHEKDICYFPTPAQVAESDLSFLRMPERRKETITRLGAVIHLSLLEFNVMKFYTYYQSPLGELTIQTSDEGILGVWFEQQTTQPQDLGIQNDQHPLLVKAIQEFQAYFAGELTSFTVPIAAIGTVFQQQVWQALTEIPYGETCCYQELANNIENPKAVRAVGMANGKNPISIIVPCHRVIGKNGKLTGYAGGVDTKAALLKLEGVIES